MISVASFIQAFVGVAPTVLIGLCLLAFLSLLVLAIGLNRAQGIPAKFAMLASGLLLLLAQSILILPPQVVMKTEAVVVMTACPDPDALQRVADSADVFLLADVERCAGLSDWLRQRAVRAQGGLVRLATMEDLAAYVGLDSRITLLGGGLSHQAWSATSFSGVIDWQRPPVLSGFSRFDWSPKIAVGAPVTIHLGRNDGALTEVVAVSIAYAGQKDALTRVSWGDENDLSMSVLDLPAGRHSLKLSALDVNDDVVTTRFFGVQIEQPDLASVLLVQDAPSFEWRALQRWLSESGAEVAIVSRVSDSRFRLRFANRDESSLTELESSIAKDYDLIVIDGAALDSDLGRQVLSIADERTGPGILIRLRDDRDLVALPAAAESAISSVAEAHVYQLAAPAWSPESGYSRLDVRFDPKLVDPLVADLQAAPVILRLTSNNRIGLSLWRDSYRAVGSGQIEAYARLWSQVVSDMAKPALAPDINASPLQAEQDSRLRVCWRQDGKASFNVIQGNDERKLNGYLSAWRPAERCDWLWPSAGGWLTVENESGERVFSHWVAPAGHWQMERAVRSNDATASFIGDIALNDEINNGPMTQPLSRLFLLPFFLLAALLHWLVQRLVFVRNI